MNTISQEFSILPGVLGSCISSRNREILFASLPEYFTSTMVDESAANIGRMMQMAKVKGLEPQTMSIRYDKFDIMAMPVDTHSMLLILCEPGTNTSLIATTACMLGPEIEKLLKQAPPPPLEKNTPKRASRVETKNQRPPVSPHTLQALTTIKQALFDTVGPIADMIYDDSFSQWTVKLPADMSRITDLFNHISKEINNPELFKEFQEKMALLLKE